MGYTVTIHTTEHTPEGIPIVRSHTITGKVTEGGSPVAGAEIVIIEPDVNDEGSGQTDANGEFRVQIHEDTMHHVYVNGIDSQLVKVITR
ncbi:MAG: hypothetical protein RL660_2700 [Bacteroidota bacterium]|jgi:hypothetical protein